VYVTTGQPPEWLLIDVPSGMITPPTFEIHRPLVGAATFYYADCYSLPIPKDARAALKAAEGDGNDRPEHR
jgi:hypothetical protein